MEEIKTLNTALKAAITVKLIQRSFNTDLTVCNYTFHVCMWS